MATHGGRYDFDDGGTYFGTWEEGKAHGYGTCSGPKGLGEFAGLWHAGFESSGVYSWPSGNTYEGQWQNGKRHGLGIETKGKWIYRGEWSMGFKGRHGVRNSLGTGAKYEGGYTSGIQEGYGVETYADGGYYSGQFTRGCRHGFGVRRSPPFSVLAQFLKDKTIRASLTSLRSVDETEEIVKQREKHFEEVHGGFVLMTIQPSQMLIDAHQMLARKARKAAADGGSSTRKPLFSKLRKQHSVSDIREGKDYKTASVRSAQSAHESDAIIIENNLQRRPPARVPQHGHYTPNLNHRPQLDQTLEPDTYVDPNVIEIYSGQWKSDKRSGFGVCERSDGLKYEGELLNNMRHGFGMTTFANGMQECGRYKNNVLAEWSDAGRNKMALFGRGSKLRDKVDDSVKQARGAAQMAVQISDVARSIQTMARQKADAADQAAAKARHDKEVAKKKAAEFLLIYPDKRAMSKGDKGKFTLIQPVQAALTSAMDCALSPGDDKLYLSARGNGGSPTHFGDGSQPALLDITASDDPQAAAYLSLSTLLGNVHVHEHQHQPSSDQQQVGKDQDAQQLSTGAIVNDLFSHYSTLKDSASTSTSSTGIFRPRMTATGSALSTASSGYGSTTLQRGDSSDVEASQTQANNAASSTNTAAESSASESQNAPLATRRATLTNTPVTNGPLLNGRPSRLLIQVSKLAQQAEEVDSDQERDLSIERPTIVMRQIVQRNTPIHTIMNDRSLPLNHVVRRTAAVTNTGNTGRARDRSPLASNTSLNANDKEKNRSVPDLHTCDSLKQHVMPREEAYRLGHARRQEIIEERTRSGDVIVIRIGVLKYWFVRHIVIIVAFVLNLALIMWLASLLPANEDKRSEKANADSSIQPEDS